MLGQFAVQGVKNVCVELAVVRLSGRMKCRPERIREQFGNLCVVLPQRTVRKRSIGLAASASVQMSWQQAANACRILPWDGFYYSLSLWSDS